MHRPETGNHTLESMWWQGAFGPTKQELINRLHGYWKDKPRQLVSSKGNVMLFFVLPLGPRPCVSFASLLASHICAQEKKVRATFGKRSALTCCGDVMHRARTARCSHEKETTSRHQGDCTQGHHRYVFFSVSLGPVRSRASLARTFSFLGFFA